MFLYIWHWNIEVNWKCAGSSLFARPKVWKAAIAQMFSSKTFWFTKQPQLARCWLGDLIKPIYIRGWWRTQVRGPSVWMLCSVRSLCRPLSWLSTNQRRPPPLNQSQRPFPLSWRDVECADVEPCNSILLSKSSRSFLWNWKYTRTFYFLHTFFAKKRIALISSLMTLVGLVALSQVARVLSSISSTGGGAVCGGAVQQRPPSCEAAARLLPAKNYQQQQWWNRSCISKPGTTPTRQQAVSSESLRTFEWATILLKDF